MQGKLVARQQARQECGQGCAGGEASLMMLRRRLSAHPSQLPAHLQVSGDL